MTVEPLLPRLESINEADKRALLYALAIANTLILLVLLYAHFAGRPPTVYWAYPIVWISVGAWGLKRSSSGAADARTRWVAGAVAGGYFLLLGVAGGLFGPASGAATGLTIQVSDLPPGWNPAVLYGGELLQVALVPFSTFGYAVLSYLVYVTAIEAKGAVAGGVLGLFSCVSCTLPVIASLLGGLVGGGALTVAANAQTYGVGTAVFVVTVLLLTYRPGIGRLRRLAE